MRRFNNLANSHIEKLLLVGLAGLALYNWWHWQRDKAHLTCRTQPDPFSPLEEWPYLPQVSVVVAAWDEAQYINQNIESFLALRYPYKEMVLCAGGEDATYQLAMTYESESVKVLEQLPGEGKQRALQRCLDEAYGEIIFLTDADCILTDEAFESSITPLILDGEGVSTGTCAPVPTQRANPFVLHQWFIQVGGNFRQGKYLSGLLGRNAALRREVFVSIGGFDLSARTGTDYTLAKQVLDQDYSIRYVPDSVVLTPYPQSVSHYRSQQSRWLRNVVLHGTRYDSYLEVFRCLTTSIVGGLMLVSPLASLFLGPVVLIGWLLVFWHILLSRVRYMRFGERATGVPFPRTGYLSLPAYILLDFYTWASVLPQYLSGARKTQW